MPGLHLRNPQLWWFPLQVRGSGPQGRRALRQRRHTLGLETYPHESPVPWAPGHDSVYVKGEQSKKKQADCSGGASPVNVCKCFCLVEAQVQCSWGGRHEGV